MSFIKLILDNDLVAFEVNHFLRRKRQGKTGIAALMIDMSKAYDQMERSFLRNVMAQMGFTGQFIDLIMLCVSSIKCFIAANGNMLWPCIPKRGFRQGDLHSPYLFLFCAEGLSALIDDCKRGVGAWG